MNSKRYSAGLTSHSVRPKLIIANAPYSGRNAPPLRPKMGIPAVTRTSTPRLDTAKVVEEEPIYCEIASPAKSGVKDPLCRTHHRHPVDCSARMQLNYTPRVQSASAAMPVMGEAVDGHRLGRRANTQMDLALPWKEGSCRVERCVMNPAGVDGAFERHRWDRNSVTSDGTSMTSYGTTEDESGVCLGTTLVKGVLWLQREKVFSRWKERFFVLTKDYLQCYKKSSSIISEMGGFVFRVRLCEVDEMELIVRRGYLTISISTPKVGRLLIRKPDGIRKWYKLIQECVTNCKERQEHELAKERFWMRKQLTDSSSMEEWIQSRRNRTSAINLVTESCYVNWNDTNSEAASTTVLRNRIPVETTDYGFIDGPPSLRTTQHRLLAYQRGTSNRELKLSQTASKMAAIKSPSSAILVRKALRCYSNNTSSMASSFSRDSGIESMNTANTSAGSAKDYNESSGSQRDSAAAASSLLCQDFARKTTLV